MPKATVVQNSVRRLTNKLIGVPQASDRTTSLLDEKATLTAKKKEIEESLAILNARLLKRVRREGTEDADGKIRLQTPTSNLQIISATNKRIDEKVLRASGVKAAIIEAATIETPYEYVGVYVKGGGKGEK